MHWRWVEGRGQEIEVELRGHGRIQAKDELISGTGNREKRVDLEVFICRWVVVMCFCQESLLTMIFGLTSTPDIAQILFCFCLFGFLKSG